MKSIATFLMFVGDQQGKAEEAINFYTSLFNNSEMVSIERWAAGEDEPAGTVKAARFTLNGANYMASENSGDHAFNFTPAISMFVECESLEELQSVYDALVDGGQVMMPIDSYGFSKQFGWVADRFGVSWQLNLAD